MNINDLVNKYVRQGYNYRNAQNLAAEEIALFKLSSSPLAEHITLKGGIVMFNITKNSRRVTQDIDFDLIRYSIDNKSIELFIKKLNSINDGITVKINGGIEQLHQEDYRGARVRLLLIDKANKKLGIKLDIGVHTYSAIEQDKTIFVFDNNEEKISINVNPSEQIFVEKLLSLSRFGPLSTRYKDIYDLYYLIKNNLLDINKVRKITKLFLESSSKKPNDVFELTNAIIDTFEDKAFSQDASKPASKWMDVEYNEVKETIVNYVSKL